MKASLSTLFGFTARLPLPASLRTLIDAGIVRLVSHLRTKLFLNAYALIVGAVVTSGLGLVYWVVAARYYPEEVIGLHSALLSTMILLSGVAQLSLNTVLVRFIPVAGLRTGRLVGWAYLLSTLFSGLLALAFGLLSGFWLPEMKFLSQQPAWLLAFIIAVVSWNIFALQDCVLTGLRQALWIPLENAVSAFAKIVLLVLLANRFQAIGVFTSSVIPIVLALLPINWLIFKKLIPQHIHRMPSASGELRLRPIVSYISGNYLAAISLSISNTLLPLIVTSHAGVKANAYFSPPWMIASVLQFIAINMASSLTVEATLDRAKLGSYFRRVLVQTAVILVPCVLFILAAAPLILRIFGQPYADEGSTTLRLLSLSTLPNVLVSLSIALARVQNRTRVVSLIQVVLCLALLGLSEAFLPIWGIAGVGLARLISQTVVALFILLFLLWSPQQFTDLENG
ncbi:MAG: lipopolysaccharide biosynthesis protein [Chloroflexota bacterium]